MKNRRTIILSVLAIAILCLSVMGLTFAYFSANMDITDDVNVNIETSSNAYIYYDTGDDLILKANQPGYTGSSIFSVKLVGENRASVNSTYDINLYVESNNFEYDPTSTEDTPELLFDIYMSTDNTNWTEVIADKDITELSGTINLVDNQKISAEANSETTQYWKVVYTYVSLDKDQSYNMNKEFVSSIKVENVE